DNSLPIRGDLARGELPVTSVALAFRWFGLSAWAGRLPLTLWSVLGLGSIYAALARLWDRRAALYALLVLATTPLYFLQARALFGEAVTFAAFAMAWSGLSVACLAVDASVRARVCFGVLGVLGLYAGFWCRGPIVNVAVPAVSVGLVGCLRPVGLSLRLLAWGVLFLGLVALGLGVEGLFLTARTADYSVFVASALRQTSELPTFDLPLGSLAHAAFPWSAAAPLALGLFTRVSDIASPARAVTLAAGLGLALSLSAAAWLAPFFGACSVPGVCCFAVLVGGALRELEAGTLSSRLLGLATAALAIVIGLDLHANPGKACSALGLSDVSLPESLERSSAWFWVGGGVALALLCALCAYEQADAPERPPVFVRGEYGRVLTTLQRLWDGNLVFAGLVLEAALVGFLLLSAISERLVPLPQLDGFGSFSRRAVAVSAVCVPLAPLLPLLAMLCRDVARQLFEAALPRSLGGFVTTRAQGLLLAFSTAGSVASLGFYPALARQLSPTEPFDRYHQLARRGEPLAVLGQRQEAPRYQGAIDAVSFEDVEPAFAWLTAKRQERRWLVIRKADLAQLNSQYRELRQQNLPIVDARSSEILLASSALAPGEPDANPLSVVVSSRAPTPQHPLHAVLDEKLEVLGWSVRNSAGELEGSVSPTRSYRFTVCYRVLAPLSGSWQSFVHVDGLQRRFNADHELLDGKYPLRLWRQNDVISDTTEITLGPNFSPGSYRVYFGLFSGDRRLPVTEGRADEDRIVAGTLQVR
ncbi:MAG TPA: hypothetical protein VNG33_04495, partial [Polyangiaceae bacterium]|nr:hypothetical protein [Polyangiaceae bacterium]